MPMERSPRKHDVVQPHARQQLIDRGGHLDHESGTSRIAPVAMFLQSQAVSVLPTIVSPLVHGYAQAEPESHEDA
jgi:hypothetical protein